jgi:hypothetical protein
MLVRVSQKHCPLSAEAQSAQSRACVNAPHFLTMHRSEARSHEQLELSAHDALVLGRPYGRGAQSGGDCGSS